MRVDRTAEEGIWRIEGEIHKRTSANNTGLIFKKMRMEVDASDYTTGGVLPIECEDGQ